MRLTWKDAVSTLFMAGIVAVYLAFLNGTTMWLISSARGTVTAVLVLGIVGGCALSAAGDLYVGTLTRPAKVLRAIATVLGVVALTAGVVGLITGSTAWLAILFGATLALWLTATIRHAFTAPAKPPFSDRDTHEVIHQDRMAVR
jgi:hypothetical protein